MSSILILGAGAMGTAITIPIADNGHAVRLVGTHLDGDIIEELRHSRIHPRLRSRIAGAVELYTWDRLGEAMQGVDLVIVGVNSLGIGWAARMLGLWLHPQTPVVLLTKGLAGDGQGLRILPEVLRDGLPSHQRGHVHLAAIGGPSIAAELAARRHTCVVLAGHQRARLEEIAALLRTSYYHVWTSTDVIGVEVCAALKNLYALAVGLVEGWLEKEGRADNGAAMHNMASAIFAQSLWEVGYLVEYLGGQPASVYSLPGAGDLYTTCQSGRNSRMGRLIGLGMGYRQAKAHYMPGDTVEGAELALAIGPTIEALLAQGSLDGAALPLLRAVIEVVCHEKPPYIPWDAFFAGGASSVE
ncbi:MAG: 2-dehydropantoate 2-reductase N-terminal domain-containing protein [Anaerolineae bacterium]